MTKVNNSNLIDTLPKTIKPAAKFVRHQEQASGLSTSRFIQDVTTCLIPKAVFSRSLADLTENTFLETSEETLIYFVPTILGERVARKIFSKGLDKNLKKEVAITGVELLERGNKSKNKKILPVKAAISLAAMAIPLTEFSLNYIKNLMTLKLFKKSDFKNIASLENSQEDLRHQEKVRKSAKRHIGFAAGLYAGCLGAGYFGASADRGKENLKETATRFPLVALYVITGSELVEKGFRKLLYKFGKCKDLIGKDYSVPKFDELGDLAKKLSEKKNTVLKDEYKSLVKQKVLISGLPYVFSIGVMGFFVAGMTNYFTKKRYQNAQKQNN